MLGFQLDLDAWKYMVCDILLPVNNACNTANYVSHWFFYLFFCVSSQKICKCTGHIFFLFQKVIIIKKQFFYVFSIHLCLSSLTCLPAPPSPLPWNPSVFLTVSCRWSNMTRACEPIHFHLVIYRHFDLPQCSSISIRGGLACVSPCVMWDFNVWSQAEPAWTLSYPSPFNLSSHLSTPKPLSWWSPLYLANDNYCVLEMGNGRLQQPISDVVFLIIEEMV